MEIQAVVCAMIHDVNRINCESGLVACATLAALIDDLFEINFTLAMRGASGAL